MSDSFSLNSSFSSSSSSFSSSSPSSSSFSSSSSAVNRGESAFDTTEGKSRGKNYISQEYDRNDIENDFVINNNNNNNDDNNNRNNNHNNNNNNNDDNDNKDNNDNNNKNKRDEVGNINDCHSNNDSVKLIVRVEKNVKKDEKKRRRQYTILTFTIIKKISLGLKSLTISFDISAFKNFKFQSLNLVKMR